MFNRSAARLAGAAGLAACVASASGQSLSWTNAAGGLAATSSNWSPSQLPTASSDLTFNLVGSYPVTFSGAVPTSHSQVYKRGAVTLTISSPHTVSSGLTVGDVSGDSGTMTLTTGSLISSATLLIGDASGSTGIVNVQDDDSSLSTGGTADLFVGNNGAGTLNITGMGSVQVADQLIAGSNATSTSNLTVSGFQAVFPFKRSTLSVLGTNQSRLGQGGDATVTVSNGALASFAGDVIVANGSASASSVTVENTGLFPATMTVAGNLNLGRNTSAGVAAGVGTLNVNAGGQVDVSGTLALGDPDGGTGTLQMTNGALLTTSSVDFGTGTLLNLTGGTLEVDGGTFSYTNANSALVLGGVNGPSIEIINGATGSIGLTVGPRSLIVGEGPGSCSATFIVTTGSTFAVTSGSVAIGLSADDEGHILVANFGTTMTLPTTSILSVGYDGTGLLDIQAGAHVTGGRMFIAELPGSDGLTNLSHPASAAQFQEVYVGGSSTAAGGSGELLVSDTTLTVPAAPSTNKVAVWADGLVTLDAGTIITPELTINGGTLSGNGTVNGDVRVSNGGIITASGGNLTLGPTGAPGTFAMSTGATLNAGANTVTLLDANLATMQNITLAGGTVSCANGLSFVGSSTISGFGTLDAGSEYTSFINGGSMTASGSGLRFSGRLNRQGGTMSGSLFGFNTGGGYTGGGTIGASVDFDAGTTIDATQNLTMGNSASASGVTLDGTLHCGNHVVTLLDSNGLALGTLTDLANGALVCAQNLVVNSGRTIAGNGSVQTPTLTVFGNIAPGDTQQSGVGVGQLHLTGALSLGVNANYNCTLGPGFENFDTSDVITSLGAASVNGTLNVALMSGFTPHGNSVFDIVTGSSVTGQFDHENYPVIPSGPMRVVYLPDRVRLVLCYANCDASATSPILNVGDFTCFLQKYASGDPYANCDGSTTAPVLNVADFTCFLQKYANGCS